MVCCLLLWLHTSGHCPVRDSLLSIAEKELGVIEVTENDAPRIRQYLGSCDIYEPNPWCAAYINWVYKQLGLSTPKYAASAKAWTEINRTKEPRSGDIGSLYYSKLGRVGHAFIIESVDEKNFITIEGNTRPSLVMDFDGDRVLRKIRPIGTVFATSNWVGDVTHEVQPGENLYRISLRYNTTVAEIQRLNGLPDNFIKVGQVLNVGGC